MQQVTVRVPCTTANLGPGFDALGLALSLYNQFVVQEIESGLKISVIGEGKTQLPVDTSNLFYRSAVRLFNEVGYHPTGLQIEFQNDVPVSSGLGSSSTAIVGGLVAANYLAGSPLGQSEILRLATELEGHPDNVASALYGGLTISVMIDHHHVITEKVATVALKAIVATPNYGLKTSESRAVLPSVVPLVDAVYNIGRTALVVRALEQGNYPLLAQVMSDKLHQPYRYPLVPGVIPAKEAALAAGAAAVALSGAGPSLIAFSADQHQKIGRAMRQAFSEAGVVSRIFILDVDTDGAKVIPHP